jgi:NAD(P)H-dependent flavin oxidoreductase YrpB (nitropropane dioxygenase family)
LNPQKGNVYQIGFQYLGFGNAFFGIENPETGRIMPVHMIKNTNARTTAVLKNPQMTTKLISKNFGSSTSVQPKSLSMAAFTEGFARKLDPRFAASHTFSGYNSTTKAPLLALKVNAVYNNQTCFAEFDILRIAASNESTNKTLTISVYKNLDINGVVNFQYVDQTNSAVSYANLTPGTNTVTTTGKVPFLTFSIGANTAETLDIAPEELVFGAGEIVVICISTSGAVTGEVGVNWFEQQ